MTDLQKSNLARVALAVFQTVPDVKFDMDNFATQRGTYGSLDPNEVARLANYCGTSCCVVGHGPVVLGPTHRSDWLVYSEEVFGIPFNGTSPNEAWTYLFSPVWPSDREQAALRILAFLEGRVNFKEDFDYGERLPADPQLEEKLRVFVQP